MRLNTAKKGILAGLAGMAGAAALLAAIPAGAAGASPSHAPKIVHGAGKMPSSLPPRYAVVSSGPFVATPGAQTPATVSCPGTETPTDGGADTGSTTWAVNINSSYPIGGEWEVWVNNVTSTDYYFYVYAICMKATSSEQIITTEGYVNPDQTYYATSECPKGTTVVGGGASVSSEDIWLGMNSSTPNQFAYGRTGWTSAITDADSVNGENFWTFAVCRPKPNGWSIAWGAAAEPTPGHGIQMAAICPGNSKAIGGGGYTVYSDTDAGEYMTDLYTDPAQDGAWYTSYQNGSNSTREVVVVAVCAGS